MFSIKFDDKFLNSFNIAAKKYPHIAAKYLLKAALIVRNEVSKNSPVGVTANLKRGWFIKEYNANRAVIQNAYLHALFIELGTIAHWMPIDPLIQWVQRKLGLSGKEAYGAARAIQISKAPVSSGGGGQATKPNPILKTAVTDKEQEIYRTLEKVFVETWE